MPSLAERKANLATQREQLVGRLAQLDQVRAQTVATVQAVDGALALIADLEKAEAENKIVPLNRAQRRRAARTSRKK